MSIDTAWLALAALALFVAWLAWTIWRAGSRRRAEPRRATALAGVGRMTASIASVHKETMSSPIEPHSPPPARAGVQRAEAAPRAAARSSSLTAAAASPVAPEATAAPAARAARPPPPRFERVLGVEAASVAAWQAALPLALLTGQAKAVAALCAPAFDAARREPANGHAVLAVSFPTASILRIARGDAPMLKAIASDNDSSTSHALAWLDSNTASALAATLLAALAAARHLDALGAEMHDLRSRVAAVPNAAADSIPGRLQATVQELWRLQREVHGHHAAAISKPASRQQVEQVVDTAVPLWRDIHARLDAARRALELPAGASTLGVDRLRPVRHALRERSELYRLQTTATRAVAAAYLLRITLGGAAMPAGVHPLQSASAGLRAGASHDAVLEKRLRLALRGERTDDEDAALEHLRAALAEGLDALAAEAASCDGVDRLGAAYVAVAEGFPDAFGGDDRWLVRSPDGTGPVEVRRAATVRLH